MSCAIYRTAEDDKKKKQKDNQKDYDGSNDTNQLAAKEAQVGGNSGKGGKAGKDDEKKERNCHFAIY